MDDEAVVGVLHAKPSFRIIELAHEETLGGGRGGARQSTSLEERRSGHGRAHFRAVEWVPSRREDLHDRHTYWHWHAAKILPQRVNGDRGRSVGQERDKSARATSSV
jgi:hypothetical protein